MSSRAPPSPIKPTQRLTRQRTRILPANNPPVPKGKQNPTPLNPNLDASSLVSLHSQNVLPKTKSVPPKAPSKAKSNEAIAKRAPTRTKKLTAASASDVEVLTDKIRRINVTTQHKGSKSLATKKVSEPALTTNIDNISQPVQSILSIAEQGKLAMKSVNSHLSHLSAIRKTGWMPHNGPDARVPDVAKKSSTETHPVIQTHDSFDTSQILQTIDDCASALYALRKFIVGGSLPSKLFDVERASLALVNHALEMGLYNSALRLLEVSHTYLQSLVSPTATATLLAIRPKPTTETPISFDAWRDFAKVLEFDLSEVDVRPAMNEDRVVLLATAVAQGFQAFVNARSSPPKPTIRQSSKTAHPTSTSDSFKIRAECCIKALDSPTSLSRWAGFSALLEQAAVDSDTSTKLVAACQSGYTSVVKACASWQDFLEPRTSFQLRKSAILSLMSGQVRFHQLSSIDLLMDQSRRTLLLYARSCPDQLGDVVAQAKCYIADIIAAARPYHYTARLLSSDKGWIGLCQAVVSLAHRAGDLELIESVTPFLDGVTASQQDQVTTHSDEAGPDIEKHISLLLTKLSAASAALENFNKSGEDRDTCQHLQKTTLSLSVLYCHHASVSEPSRHKLDSGVDRLRRLCVRTIRRREDTHGQGKKSVQKSVQSACCIVLNAIIAAWDEEIRRRGQFVTDQSREFGIYSMMVSGAIEALICIAEYSFQPSVPETHADSLDKLERCKPLIRLLPSPDVSVIRCITSVYYNSGVALYQATRHMAAIPFVRQACQYPGEIFKMDPNTDMSALWASYDDVNNELDGLREQLTKRWELLALCCLGTDKELAYEAYVSAILSHTMTSFSRLAELSGQSVESRTMSASEPNLCKLVQRATRLATWDLLLPGHRCSLYSRLKDHRLPSASVGGVLEVQLQFLYSNIRKGECRPAIRAILSDCLRVYDGTQYPLRRARTLCRVMEWHVSYPRDLTSGPLEITLDDSFQEISRLCDSRELGDDGYLASYRNQYLAFSHIWMALASQQTCKTVEFLDACKSTLNKLQAITQSLPYTNVNAQDRLQKRSSSSSTRPATGVRNRNLAPAGGTLPNPLATPAAKSRIRSIKKCTDRSESSDLETVFIPELNYQVVRATTTHPLDDMERSLQHLRLFVYVLAVHGLIHSKLAVLQLLKQIYEYWSYTFPDLQTPIDGVLVVTIEMVLTYMQLQDYDAAGRTLPLRNVSTTMTATSKTLRISESVLELLRSRHFSEADQRDCAVSAFESARELWLLTETEDVEALGPNSQVSSTQRVIKRSNALYMSALASSTYSHVEENAGDLNLAIDSTLRSIRLLHRASTNILRISSPPADVAKPSPTATADDVFGSNKPAHACVPLPDVSRDVKSCQLTTESHPVGELTWQIASATAEALRRAVVLYLAKGSPRMAEGYLTQLLQFADKIGSISLKAHAKVMQAEMRILMGESDGAQAALDDAASSVGNDPSAEIAEIWRLRATLSYRLKKFEEAREHCTATYRALKAIELPTSDQFHLLSKSVKKMTLKPGTHDLSSLSPFLSTTAARAICIQARASRDRRRAEDMADDLTMLSRLPSKARKKVFETTLVALAELDNVLQNYRVDPVLGVLPEAMIAIPPRSQAVGKSAVKKEDIPRISQAIKKVEQMLSKHTVECANVWNLQETISTLMTLKFIRCILGRAPVNAAAEVAALMDFASSITLRREMLDVVRGKLRCPGPVDDLMWPTISSGSSGRDSTEADVQIHKYWSQVQLHHTTDLCQLGTYRPIDDLPDHWRIVSLHLSQDQDSIFLVRHYSATDPLVLKLPMNRQSRREGEEDSFTLSTALEELRAIVSRSNAATQRARHVSGHADKLTWWTERKELDSRMRRLVENIEHHWLGACKGFLRSVNTVREPAALRIALEKVFRRHLMCLQDRTMQFGELDDHVIEAFTSLRPNCRDEDLEDLIQFAVDCYQMKEAPVVGDEVDADQVVCELRDIQKDMLKPAEASSQQHLFLILDKHLHGFPWECLPHLRGHSISRIPSLSFLRDRLATLDTPLSYLASSQTALDQSPSPVTNVKTLRTSYILNPSGDLNSTQKMFEPWLAGHSNWNGIIGRSPTSDEYKQALLTSDLMLYFGHGGAEQYIRSITIKQLPRCAVTMLWGCSSGMLQDQGDFDPSGTPYAYMLAGCPSLVANLWDVTDKDIDALTMQLFIKTGLHPSDEKGYQPVSLTQALAEARSSCQLRYLNGAAPVVYGMPVHFHSSL